MDFITERPSSIVIVAIAVLSIVTWQPLREYSNLFKASLLGLPTVEFDGTTTPIEKVPRWTDLTDSERTMRFHQIPGNKLMNLPEYNVGKMRRGMNWQTATDEERNIYITYPVPNLGNYKLDATENSGSHPGVDIKTPIGTPVRAIAAGVVTKARQGSTGYGNHIVIVHQNVPDPENPGRITTLYSGYAHLSTISVSEGKVVKKGEIIGQTGDSGDATAPHLHFQIDREDAPFFPYWPLTWDDIRSAGFSSTFDAVKSGLNRSIAQKYTVHPINFVAQNLDYSGGSDLVVYNDTPASTSPTTSSNHTTSSSPSSTPAPPTTTAPPAGRGTANTNSSASSTPTTNPPTNTAPKPTPQHQVDPAPTASTTQVTKQKTGQLIVEFDTNRSFIPGEEKEIIIRVNEPTLVASAGLELSSTLKNYARVTPEVLTADDFVNGQAVVRVKPYSESIFRLVASSEYGTVRSPSFRPAVFADVDGTDRYADAIKYLKEREVVSGYPDGTFRPDNTLNRAEAVKLVLEANDIKRLVQWAQKFSDVPGGAWFEAYVATAVERGIVSGYADGEFKPGNKISRAEFLKIAIATAGLDVHTPVKAPYPDVTPEEWFAPYFQLAKEYELLSAKMGGYMTPHQPITRAEAADILYRISRM